jgi:hypothetical protein
MTAKRISIFLCSLWDIARFFILISIITAMFDAVAGGGITIVAWLLLPASAALLVPVGGILLTLYPVRYANLVGLLRLGKVLNLFSLFLLLVYGFISDNAEAATIRLSSLHVSQAILFLLVMLGDLIFLGLLISYKTEVNGS